ncbi:MAG: HAD family hydrolase [Solirubrobacteraceae bacterium]
MLVRAVACDLDGTLLCSDGTIDPRTRAALTGLQRAGILLVIATARPGRWVAPLARTAGHGGLAICANGAVIWDLHSEAVVNVRALAPAIAGEIVARLRPALPGAAWAVERADGYGHEPSYTPRWPVPDSTVIAPIETLVREPAVKLVLRDAALGADELLAVARELVGDLAECSHSNSTDSLLEICAAGVSKATALESLCAGRGIDASEVLAFGDMPNDLAMLVWAGRGVAVANAHPEVLAAADEITAGNDEAGVAIVLERLLSDAGPAAVRVADLAAE